MNAKTWNRSSVWVSVLVGSLLLLIGVLEAAGLVAVLWTATR